MFVFPTMTAAPSARTQALAQKLSALVREHHAQDPSVQAGEVQQAFALAQQQLATEFGGSARRAQILAVLLLSLALALGLVVAMFSMQPVP